MTSCVYRYLILFKTAISSSPTTIFAAYTDMKIKTERHSGTQEKLASALVYLRYVR